MNKTYRSDIQILRGIAVLLVVLYHAACPLLPGGLIGVDVFFVISGFLMAFAIGDLNISSILHYYGRRTRRILPAFFVTIFAVWIVAVIIALPFEVQQYTSQILFYLAALPNAALWMDNSYFAPQLFRPGLHFWSLGVELQFYLILPLLVLLHRKSRLFTVAIMILSLAASLVMTDISAKTAFFLTPFRVWEFLAGFLVAGMKPPKAAPKFLPYLLMAGLAACATIAIPEDSFPGFYALPPVVLSAAIVYLGFSSRLKIFKALEVVGEYSYSIYLVHYPVFIFLFYQPFATKSFVEFWSIKTLLALILTGLLSYALYTLVENPLRRRKLSKREVSRVALAVFMAGIFCFVAGPKISAAKYPPTYEKIFAAFHDKDTYRCGKIKRLTEPFTASCTLVKSGNNQTALIVGNSYADALKPVLISEAQKSGTGLRLMKENCALGEATCSVSSLLEEIKITHITHVILHASPGTMKAENITALVKEAGKNHFKIILIDPTPAWKDSVPMLLYNHIKNKSALPVQTGRDYRTANKDLLQGTSRISSPAFKRYKTEKFFCAPECMFVDENQYPLYFDSGHLTLHGTEILRPLAGQIFSEMR